MNRSFRFLLGIGVLSILIPALMIVMPSTMSGLNPWATDDGPATRGSENLVAAADPKDRGRLPASENRAIHRTPSKANNASRSEGKQKNEKGRDTTTTTQDDQFTTTTSGTDSPGSSTTAPSPTTPSTEGGGSAGVTGSEITGHACPCTVTGTASLVGKVSLQGDLVVSGGTLIARPGVNVDGNGFQIMFMDGGRADFQGTPTSTWSGNGSNANITRDINFRNLRRIMFHMGAGRSTLRYFTITDSGTSTLGDYSLHFHMNGNTTRGTLVEGVAVVNSRHHAFVPHASHGITFKDTIAKNGKCEAYWWDPPEFQSTSEVNNSNDIVYSHALADGVTNCPGDDRGFRLSAFELGAGRGNTIKNSVARNVSPTHAKDCSGFKWPELSDKQPSSWGFTNNASYGSKCNGIFVWQNDYEEHIVNGFSGDGIDHGAYVNRYDYRNINVSFVEVHALGWSATGGKASKVTVFRHTLDGGPVTFTNVDIGEFIVNNASGGGTLPGRYILNGTGLSCNEIVYDSVVAKTRVVIDGKEC